MESIVLPELHCPFAPMINMHVEAVHQHTLEWVGRFDLVATEADWQRFRAAKFAWLAARAYPTASLEALKLVAEWNIWLFIHDDQCDEAGLGRQPAALAALYDELRPIVRGAAPAANSSGIMFALHDLIGRMRARASDEWLERFVYSVDDYFEACVWEARNRAAGRVPDVESYVQMRPFTGALNTDIELIELCERIYLPAEVYAHPDVQRLTLMANNVVCWANDIISLEKELRHGDVHNLVVAIQHEGGCGLQEAVQRARAMHDSEVRAFVDLAERAPWFGARIAAELERYLVILRAWMRGNLDWAYDTGRYGAARRAVAA
jgi:5-epi-alpha-selinene synthase